MDRTASPLSIALCKAKAAECRDLAREADQESHRVMLEHVANTWERIGDTLQLGNKAQPLPFRPR